MDKVINTEKMIIKSIDQITCFNNADELEFMLDELTDATISNTQEKQDVTGKNGRKLASLKRNKAVSVTATNGFVSAGLMGAHTGTSVETGTFNVRITDIITVKDNEAESAKTALGTVGAEIGVLYKKNADGSLGEKLEQNVTVDTGKFTYDPATKKFVFKEDEIPNGTEYVAFYDVEVEAAKVSNDSETYSKVLKMYIDMEVTDSCDESYHAQVIIPRADFSGNFDFTVGDNAAVGNLEAEALAGGCGNDSKFWDMIIY